MPPVGVEPKTSAGERSHIYALDRAATGTDTRDCSGGISVFFFNIMDVGLTILGGSVAVVIMPRAGLLRNQASIPGRVKGHLLSLLFPNSLRNPSSPLRAILRSVLPGARS